MKETTKKFIYLQLDRIKSDLKDNYSGTTNECYKLRGMIQYMRYNNDITYKEYKNLNNFTLNLVRLSEKKTNK